MFTIRNYTNIGIKYTKKGILMTNKIKRLRGDGKFMIIYNSEEEWIIYIIDNREWGYIMIIFVGEEVINNKEVFPGNGNFFTIKNEIYNRIRGRWGRWGWNMRGSKYNIMFISVWEIK